MSSIESWEKEYNFLLAKNTDNQYWFEVLPDNVKNDMKTTVVESLHTITISCPEDPLENKKVADYFEKVNNWLLDLRLNSQ